MKRSHINVVGVAPCGSITSKYVLIAAVDLDFPFFIGTPMMGEKCEFETSPGCSGGPGVEPETWPMIEH